MWPFRLRGTASDGPDRHQTTLDMIEQVTALRGQVRALEAEWLDMRDQLKKSYQRMEKANERAEKRLAKQEELAQEELLDPEPVVPVVPLRGFAKKLHDIQGGS